MIHLLVNSKFNYFNILFFLLNLRLFLSSVQYYQLITNLYQRSSIFIHIDIHWFQSKYLELGNPMFHTGILSHITCLCFCSQLVRVRNCQMARSLLILLSENSMAFPGIILILFILGSQVFAPLKASLVYSELSTVH